MPKKRSKKQRTRIYWRERGGELRAYGDFRDFADVDGGREALIPERGTVATSDPLIAEKLAADRLAELQERRRNKHVVGIERQAGLKEFVAHHLVQKAKAGRVTAAWLGEAQRHLDTAIAFFGATRDLAAITVHDVQLYANHLAERPNGRGGKLSGSSRHHYLVSLSNLYRRAQGEGYVRPGFNPVSALMEKPKPARAEARWLETPDAALLLESARTYKPEAPHKAMGFVYPLLATFLLTGGRKAEVLGLEVEDVSFDRRTITFRPHAHRRLKTVTSHRSVPLWPQLEEILREHVFGGPTPRVSGLLFPSARLNGSGMVKDVRKALDAVAERAGWSKGEIRTKMFRHTYCAARLQTLDRGAPVAVYTVSREMGHGGETLVRRVYGHLGDVRHRAEIVEYRADQQLQQLEAEAAAAEADLRRRAEAARLRGASDSYRDRLRALRGANRGDKRLSASQRQPTDAPAENQPLTGEAGAGGRPNLAS